MKTNPKQYVPAARHIARKTKPRAQYQPAPCSEPAQRPEQERLLAYPWPFPVSAVRGRLVRNRFSPGLCMTMEVLRVVGLARPMSR